jgi:hypothetical protein
MFRALFFVSASKSSSVCVSRSSSRAPLLWHSVPFPLGQGTLSAHAGTLARWPLAHDTLQLGSREAFSLGSGKPWLLSTDQCARTASGVSRSRKLSLCGGDVALAFEPAPPTRPVQAVLHSTPDRRAFNFTGAQGHLTMLLERRLTTIFYQETGPVHQIAIISLVHRRRLRCRKLLPLRMRKSTLVGAPLAVTARPDTMLLVCLTYLLLSIRNRVRQPD